MNHVPEIGISTNGGVSKGIIDIEFNCLDDDEGINGQENDEWAALVREQIANRVKHFEDFPLLHNV